jgi:hypothetical protein
MRESPPAHLIAMLEGLGLASAGDLCRMGRRVGRLARDLPRFESVWIDALAQARIITRFQAAEINAGRAESLRVGPYLLCAAVGPPGYAACYRARRVDSRRLVRLAVAEHSGDGAEEIVGRLETLAAASAKLRCEQLTPISEAGADGRRIWAASPWVEGRTAAEWLVHNGRFSPEAVLEIAREMVAGLVILEQAGICHGDVGAATLMLRDSGGVVLLQPGLRAILRPEEGYAHADLLPEAYDCLAPERISDGTPPTIAGDVYGCGCVWWQMLCGRPPLSGGDSLGKLRAAQAAKVCDVRRLAGEVPEELRAAISACLEREPGRRPESMARLAAMLGTPIGPGRSALARRLAGPVRSPGAWAASDGAAGRIGRWPLWPATVVGLLAAAAIFWPIWRLGTQWRDKGGQESAAQELPSVQTARKAQVAKSSETAGEARLAGRSDLNERTDRPVIAAHYEAPSSPSEKSRRSPEDLVLASDGPLRIESLRVRSGQCVRGAPGKRPVVMVPRAGLAVGAEEVRFENVDFVWDHPAQVEGPTVPEAAIVRLSSARAEFRGCVFRAAGRTGAPPVAIRWTHPADSQNPELSLPSGRVQLRDCVLRGVGAGVDCRTLGALAVELTNTLHLGGGTLVRLHHCPKADEPVLIALEQVTLRGAGPVLECDYRVIGDPPGEISIRAARCAFVPQGNRALLRFDGPESPERILKNILWTGQGSLVSPEAAIAAWHPPGGRQQVLDEAAVTIEGLVRSEVGFAGNADAGAAASRIIRWQAPVLSTDPPGIDLGAGF